MERVLREVMREGTKHMHAGGWCWCLAGPGGELLGVSTSAEDDAYRPEWVRRALARGLPAKDTTNQTAIEV